MPVTCNYVNNSNPFLSHLRPAAPPLVCSVSKVGIIIYLLIIIYNYLPSNTEFITTYNFCSNLHVIDITWKGVTSLCQTTF